MGHYQKSNKAAIVFFFLVLFPVFVQSQVSYNNDIFEIKHELFSKRFKVSKKVASPIILEIFDQNGNDVLVNSEQVPFFEFIVQQKRVSSLDAIWQYKEFETRELGNGGTEVKLAIEGVKGPVKNLVLNIYQQFFPEATLIRERLELLTTSDKQFPLNKLDGKIHFIFPQYSINSSEAVSSTEIRIASFASELIDVDEQASFDERFPEGNFNDHNLAYNHMFHPKVINRELTKGSSILSKGPMNVIRTEDIQWFSAYEHASQDDLRGIFKGEAVQDGGLILDAGQGTHGQFNFTISSKDFHFLGFDQKSEEKSTRIAVKGLRGLYLEDEPVDRDHPYSSVWTATAFSTDTSWNTSKRIMHDYLWKWICEKSASRKPEFYYNTWGMQRRIGKTFPKIRELMTEEHLTAEIRRAAELGVDIFVLDDGWEQAQGDWTPHRNRLPDGLAPIKAELAKHGITMGIWLSPMGIDSTVQRYKEHPEWVVRDSNGKPIGAQWRHPAFDFVSGFYDHFVADCKLLVDAGARFFKWDAINTFYSRLPNLHHGSDKYSEAEIRARYEYLLPIYVTRAMKEITDYEPEVVIEIDLTEARRVMTGLAPLSQGKLFWMNNGASGYGDYTSYRTRSMRTIPNQYAGIIPLELFTYANYPHNAKRSMRYNVNTSLLAGHGFWGALEEMRSDERKWIGKQVRKSKRVLPYFVNTIPEVIGKVGASPEIYTQFNIEEGAGQVIAFSGSALAYRHCIAVKENTVLGVLNHAYQISEDTLIIDFQFPMPEATREAFVLPNEGKGIRIVSSTSWIDDLKLDDSGLEYRLGAPGEQIIHWDKKNGTPVVREHAELKLQLTEESEYFILNIVVEDTMESIKILARQ